MCADTGHGAWSRLFSPSKLPIWPAGTSVPVVFCHMTGEEEVLATSTAEGGEQSRSNKQQVDKAVS